MARRYDGDTVARVVVADGRVAFGGVAPAHVGTGVAQAVLPARTMGEYSDSGHIAVTQNVALDDALDWTAGRLVFRDTPLRDAVPRLERRYDVTIRLPERMLENETFTSTFANEPLAQVLDVLALTFHATYTRSGPGDRVITFTSTHAPVRRVAPMRDASSLAPEVSYGK